MTPLQKHRQTFTFEDPVILCADAHSSYGYIKKQDLSLENFPLYAPIAWFELANIARCYPILFIDNDAIFPVAITAPMAGGEIAFNPATAILPAVVQLYPFMIEKVPNEDAGVLIFDQKNDQIFPMDQNPLASPLFDSSGTPTHVLRQIAAFAAQFYDGRIRATAFAQAVKTAGILMPSQLELSDIGPNGARLHRLYTINDQAYRALPKDTIYEWLQQGWLDAISLILASQHHWLNYRTNSQATINGAER